MAWVATAIVGSAVVGGVSSYLGANAQADAMGDASDTQAETQRYIADLQQKQYEQTREDYEPWRLAGENALKRIEDTPDFTFDAETFNQYKDPSYDWRVKEGVNAIEAGASARGNLFSGANQKALMRYGQGMASQEYQNAFNRAKSVYDTNLNTDKSLAGVGQQATNSIAGAGQNMVNAISNSATSSGNNLANLQMQAGANTANMYGNMAQGFNQGAGNWLLYKQLGSGNIANSGASKNIANGLG